MVARLRDFFDSFVVIDHFERTEVKLADVCGGERIFPPALSALEAPS